MTADVKDLLEQALRLPREARAALAGELLKSLDDDDEVDEDAEAAWAGEIKRRIEEMESGKVRGTPWSEAQKRIHDAATKPRST